MERPGTSERRALGAAGSASALAATRPLDLRHHARTRIEELLLGLGPATDVLDREQLRPQREVEAARGALHEGSIAVLRKDPLRLVGAQELQERLRLGLVLRRRRDRDRILDQDRRLRDHELDRLALLLRKERLVLVHEKHVAAADEERLQSLACARGLRDHVLPELSQVA